MANARIEKLKLSRRHRDVFGARVHVRLTHRDMARLDDLSAITGRSVSDLVRAAVQLVLAAGPRVAVVDEDEELLKLRKK